jgi:hypothetical protein
MNLLHAMHSITESPWFAIPDMAFHIVVVGHVVAHLCKAGKSIHQKVHVPAARLWARLRGRTAPSVLHGVPVPARAPQQPRSGHSSPDGAPGALSDRYDATGPLLVPRTI